MSHAPAPSAPPYCPNDRCAYHQVAGRDWHWVRTGFFRRAKPPFRVQRFQCCHCRRHFSEQTFRTTYWLKCPEWLEPVFHHLVGCAGFRQVARELSCSSTTIATHAARIARHCQLFHELHRPKGPIAEPLVLDTFVSFEYSQFHPTGFHMLVGKHSHYVHGFTMTELRRSGRMTREQKKTRAKIEAKVGKPDPRGTEQDVAALLKVVLAGSSRATLHTDEHTDYPLAIRHVPEVRFEHRTINSRAARTARNPLFAVNLLDMLARHSSANHKRETIAFSKRRQCAAERLWAFITWRNYVKHFSERKKDATPAQRLGVSAKRIVVEELLKQRLFPSRVALAACWQAHYWRNVPTRMIPNSRSHRRCYAV
jgi:transposase-like protein